MTRYLPDAAVARSILGLAATATAEDVTKAFRDTARRLHPDTGGPTADAEAFADATDAYNYLTGQGRDRNGRHARYEPRRRSTTAEARRSAVANFGLRAPSPRKPWWKPTKPGDATGGWYRGTKPGKYGPQHAFVHPTSARAFTAPTHADLTRKLEAARVKIGDLVLVRYMGQDEAQLRDGKTAKRYRYHVELVA